MAAAAATTAAATAAAVTAAVAAASVAAVASAAAAAPMHATHTIMPTQAWHAAHQESMRACNHTRQQLRFSRRFSSAARNRVHAQIQWDLGIRSPSRGAYLPSPPSDAGCAGIARARRRGHLAKFGSRGGVRWRAGTQSRGARGALGAGARTWLSAKSRHRAVPAPVPVPVPVPVPGDRYRYTGMYTGTGPVPVKL